MITNIYKYFALQPFNKSIQTFFDANISSVFTRGEQIVYSFNSLELNGRILYLFWGKFELFKFLL